MLNAHLKESQKAESIKIAEELQYWSSALWIVFIFLLAVLVGSLACFAINLWEWGVICLICTAGTILSVLRISSIITFCQRKFLLLQRLETGDKTLPKKLRLQQKALEIGKTAHYKAFKQAIQAKEELNFTKEKFHRLLNQQLNK